MKRIIIIITICFFFQALQAQTCDIAQAGVKAFNSTNSAPVTTIDMGETANFRFTIRNSGNGTCAIPAGTVTAVLDFPTMAGGLRPYVYAGPPTYISGYFTWTYNREVDVLIGTNNREIPAGTTDMDITMRVRGNATGSGISNLNINQGKGISDNVANNFSGARIIVGSSRIASIDLRSFTAKASACNIKLAWTTQSETSPGQFEIEFSGDGFSFTRIGTVAAKNIPGGSDYEYSWTPTTAKGYYRLKLVYPDGRTEYSEDLYASANCVTKGKVLVYPNPVQYDRKLVVNISGFNGKIRGEMFDVSGKKIQEYVLVNQVNELTVRNLAAGSYILKVTGEDGFNQGFKVIVTH